SCRPPAAVQRKAASPVAELLYPHTTLPSPETPCAAESPGPPERPPTPGNEGGAPARGGSETSSTARAGATRRSSDMQGSWKESPRTRPGMPFDEGDSEPFFHPARTGPTP